MPKDIDPYDYFAYEDEYPDVDYEGACERLAAALRCKTVYTSAEGTDWGEFQKLQDLMQTSSPPAAVSAGTFELVGHSVLITVPGSDLDLDAVRSWIAHQDVVPVVCGTEDRMGSRRFLWAGRMMSGCGVAVRSTSRTCSWPSSRRPNTFCQRG